MNARQNEQNDLSQDSEITPNSALTDTIRYILLALVLIVGTWYCFFRQPAVHADHKVEGRTMGTFYAVKVHGFPVSKAKTDSWQLLTEDIQRRLDEIDGAMSTFKPDSDVCRFNASDSTDWFAVSRDTAFVVDKALEISRLTGGAFDVTVAPIVNLWGFGPSPPVETSRLEQKTAELKERIGFEKLEARLDPPALKKTIPELTVDLSAIAKGYAADAVGQLLESKKLGHYMVEVGGEVRCRGNKGEKRNWAIAILKPLIAPPGLSSFFGNQRTLWLKDQCLATSGDYQNYRNVDNVRYSHIVDPRTGFPTEKIMPGDDTPRQRIGSVSVLDKECARADALATALFVLGEKEGIALAESQKIAVLYLLRTGGDDPNQIEIIEKASSFFPAGEPISEKK